MDVGFPSPAGSSPAPRSLVTAQAQKKQEVGQSCNDIVNWIPFLPHWMCRVEKNNLYPVEQDRDTDESITCKKIENVFIK